MLSSQWQVNVGVNLHEYCISEVLITSIAKELWVDRVGLPYFFESENRDIGWKILTLRKFLAYSTSV